MDTLGPVRDDSDVRLRGDAAIPPAEVKPEPLFWSCDDGVESLTETDMDECIENYLDGFWPGKWEYPDKERERIAVFLGNLPNALEVYGYARTETKHRELYPWSDIFGDITEYIEEDELGDPDGRDHEDCCSEDGVRVKAAIEALARAVTETYTPWHCEVVETRSIDPVAWIKEHHPEWLEP